MAAVTETWLSTLGRGRIRGTAGLRAVSLLALLIVTAGFWIFFAAFARGFLSDFNLFGLLRFAAIGILIGFAQMVVLSIGDMNLAVGAVGGAAGMFAGWLMAMGLPVLVAALLAIALGCILGLGSGVLIRVTGLNSFIVTLAAASLITGALLILTQARPFSSLPPSLTDFAQVELPGTPISPFFVVMLLIGLGLFLLYRNTSLGREMLAIGANRRAALMSGLAVGRVVLLTHLFSGLLASVAGVMSIAANNTASPGLGSDWVLTSFVAPAIGGTLLSGGLVSVFGTVIGGILVATLGSGLLLVGVDNFWLEVCLGVVLLLAVVLDWLTRAAGGATQ